MPAGSGMLMSPGTQLRSSISRRSRTRSRSRLATASRSRRSAGPSAPSAVLGLGQGHVGRRQVARPQSLLRLGQRGRRLLPVPLGRHRPVLLPLGRLPVHPPRPHPDEGEDQHPRPRDRRLPPPPLPLLGRLRTCGRRRRLPLRPPQPVLDRRQVGRHRRRDRPRVPRPGVPVRGQAPLAQRDQLRVRPAPVEPGEGVVEFARAPPGGGPRRPSPRSTAGRPVRISQRTAPRPNTSARSSSLSISPPACSGDMYAGVPSTLPACVYEPGSDDRSVSISELPSRRSGSSGVGRGAVSDRTLASPQSMTWTSPNCPTMTFAGFRSRWITPLLWAYPTACATWRNAATSRAAVRGRVRRAGRRGCRP